MWNCKQWGMADNGEHQTMWNCKQWGMADNEI